MSLLRLAALLNSLFPSCPIQKAKLHSWQRVRWDKLGKLGHVVGSNLGCELRCAGIEIETIALLVHIFNWISLMKVGMDKRIIILSSNDRLYAKK